MKNQQKISWKPSYYPSYDLGQIQLVKQMKVIENLAVDPCFKTNERKLKKR